MSIVKDEPFILANILMATEESVKELLFKCILLKCHSICCKYSINKNSFLATKLIG